MAENRGILELTAKQLLIDNPHPRSLEYVIASVFVQPVEEGKAEDPQETRRFESVILEFRDYFQVCVETHPNELVLKLSKVINSTTDIPVVRTLTIFLMYSFLFKSPFIDFLPETLSALKRPILSLLQQELSSSIFCVVSRVVSLTGFNVFGGGGVWSEYFDYVDSLIHHPSEFKKGLWLVLDLPLNIPPAMFLPFANKIESRILNYLDREEDEEIWLVAFGASVSMIIIFRRDVMAEKLLNRIKIPVKEMINNGKHVFVKNGLGILDFLVKKEAWRVSSGRFRLVTEMIDYILEIDSITKEIHDEAVRVRDILSMEDVVAV